MAFDPAFTLLALAALAGFYLAWNIGANDVANAMGTAVGSGAIRLATALVIAGVFEFAGAMLVGDTVSQTLERGVIDAARFDFGTRDYAIGLAVALFTAGGWLNVASSRGWPVSTTHSIVGALVGAGIAGGGFDAVRWPTVGIIAVTWVVTPILGGLLAYALFRLMQSLVLDARSPLARLRWWGPVFVAPIFATVAFAAEFRTPALLGSAIDPRPALVDAALVALVSGALVVPLFLRATRGAEALSHNESMVRAERVFGRLQILTACFIAFAHGSNDVANAVGPLAGVFRSIAGASSAVATAPWVLTLLGAVGVVVGLAAYGYRVIETVGTAITELTPTRGFVAEASASTVIVAASGIGLPVSATHALVGAIVGVGFARSIGAINAQVLRSVGTSWLVTLPATAVAAAALTRALIAFF